MEFSLGELLFGVGGLLAGLGAFIAFIRVAQVLERRFLQNNNKGEEEE